MCPTSSAHNVPAGAPPTAGCRPRVLALPRQASFEAPESRDRRFGVARSGSDTISAPSFWDAYRGGWGPRY
jgi:hypothetical protein